MAVPPTTSNKSKSKSTAQPKASALSVGGFDWSGRAASPAPSASSSEDEAEASTSRKTKSKSKKSNAVDLAATAPDDSRPSSISEFDRALLSSPNSSFIWIQYMSFHLQLHEIEKARQIGRRALEKINYREEEEKLNVWMALVNLEIGFGTDETSEKIFKEASSYNDARLVHMRYAEALHAAGKENAAEEIYKKTVKKFGAYPESWLKSAEFYLKKGDVKSARELLPRSLKSLDKPQRKFIVPACPENSADEQMSR
jgi:rRNA biogenesis protein RRP5